MYTDDPIADFLRYDAEQERKLEMLPVCVCCGEPIQTEEYYDINDDLFCPECMEDNFKRWTGNYIKE